MCFYRRRNRDRRLDRQPSRRCRCRGSDRPELMTARPGPRTPEVRVATATATARFCRVGRPGRDPISRIGIRSKWEAWSACLSAIRLLIWPCLVPKNFQDSPSYRILRRIHGALNIYENKNYLHSSSVNREMNLLRLVTL